MKDIDMRLIVRKPQLEEIVGLTYSSVRRLVAAGKFPPPRQLSDGLVGWRMADLKAWADNRPVANGLMRGERTRVERAEQLERQALRRKEIAA
jgi:predicted DNA-binding transcriptional regulator AlpA